jgi:Uma2 family endonuclease
VLFPFNGLLWRDMSEAFDWSWLRDAVAGPEITLDLYLALPEDLSRQIEVEDGRIIHCESPSPSHQRISRNLIQVLMDCAEKHDREARTCHEVNGELDVLFTEVPRFHYRRPDVIVYRCVPRDRGGRWRDKPQAGDVIIAIEVVSESTITEDLSTKRALYASAGIPHYWIIRMAGGEGIAISVERLTLSVDRHYVTSGSAYRDRDLDAVSTADPFPITITWQQLDRGFPAVLLSRTTPPRSPQARAAWTPFRLGSLGRGGRRGNRISGGMRSCS